jgi:peptide/nickel transport system permease protein
MLRSHPALRRIARRAAWYLLTFAVAVTINFFLPRLGDANPIDKMMARAGAHLDSATAKEKEDAYLREFGLAEVDASGNVIHDAAGKPVKTPLIKQFGKYLWMTFHGDLGTSLLQYPKPVGEIIANALPWTLALQIPTIIVGWLVGNLLGALAAYKRSVFDRVLYPMALLMTAIPSFCFAILLVYSMGIRLEWFPAVGGYDEGMQPSWSWAFFASAGYYYVLPFTSVFLLVVGGQAIGMRSMCIYEIGADYIKYAKLLGIREHKILLYMFRNAMLPQLTGLALAIGGMVGGALITEMIFSYPGLGMTILTAIQSSDYPVVSGCTLLITVCVLVANFGVDLLIGWLDPRVRAAEARG